ncbi:hypothetical protein ACF0H5_014178 [Mactra antiquata]
METLSCGNLTDFCRNCDRDTASKQLIYTVIASVLCYIGGVLSVIMFLMMRMLKERKIWCFKEKVEPFKGKWEGASQKATLQVLKKHTLEHGSSLEKSGTIESSVEVKNELEDSNKHSSKGNDNVDLEKSDNADNKLNDEGTDTGVSKTEHNGSDLSESNNENLEASGKQSTISQENQNTETEPKLDENDTLNTQGHQDVNEPPSKDNGQVNKEGKEDSKEGKETQENNETTTENNSTSDDIVKPDKIQLDITNDGKDTDDATKDATKVDEETTEVPVIVCDSTGAELYEKGRDSSVYDPNDLSVQNDNFRISHLSSN